MAGSRRSDDMLLAFAPGAAPHLLVVEARYYEDIADELLAGVTHALQEVGASFDVITVPGALEIPSAIAMALDATTLKHELYDGVGAALEIPPEIAMALDATALTPKSYDGVVALGCVIRGETSHYDIVAGESARALMDLSVKRALPLGNGILTVETQEQAFARARVSEMNKGGAAALTALRMIALKRRLFEGAS